MKVFGINGTALVLATLVAMPHESNAMPARLGKMLIAGGVVVAVVAAGAFALYRGLTRERRAYVDKVDRCVRSADRIIDAQIEGPDALAALSKAQETLSAYQVRAQRPFNYQVLYGAFRDNVSNLPVPHNDPRGAYESVQDILGYDVHGLPSERIADNLNVLLNWPGITEEKKRVIRQLDYIFRCEALRENYDAFLSGSEKAIARLQIPANRLETLQACRERILVRINDLRH